MDRIRGLLRTMTGLITILFVIGLQMGCSADVDGNGNQVVDEKTETIVQVDGKVKSIPYKQLLYSKSSLNFAWERDNSDGLSQEIVDRYGEFKTSVPGGFIVKETDTEYFICVSIGEKESVTKGFEIISLTLPEENTEKDPILKIDVIPVMNENNSDKKMKGKVFIRSLISVSKEDLPDGIVINSIIMSGS
ncbi:hypothetical protein ACP8HI_11535 [Paenibacillus sp. FA6]|uniref:hypothetical protein n=1 Tax=Paenibacillus sp. FA6 TaxID=3413029 RepID=UPI003F6561F3